MKLMKIYDIQKNYRMHKDRLLSISSFNHQDKTKANLQTTINKINNYKRKRLLSEGFVEKQKIDKICTENELLRNRMIEVSRRENELIKEGRSQLKSHDSMKSLKNGNIATKYLKENSKFRKRLIHTKSNYYQLNINNKHPKKTNRRKELVYLLESQLGIKPRVIFPQVRQSPIRSIQKLKNVRSYTENNTQGLSRPNEKHSFSIKYSIDLQKN